MQIGAGALCHDSGSQDDKEMLHGPALDVPSERRYCIVRVIHAVGVDLEENGVNGWRCYRGLCIMSLS